MLQNMHYTNIHTITKVYNQLKLAAANEAYRIDDDTTSDMTY